MSVRQRHDIHQPGPCLGSHSCWGGAGQACWSAVLVQEKSVSSVTSEIHIFAISNANRNHNPKSNSNIERHFWLLVFMIYDQY